MNTNFLSDFYRFILSDNVYSQEINVIAQKSLFYCSGEKIKSVL